MNENNLRYLEELRIEIVKNDREKAKVVMNSLIKDISAVKPNGITNLELQKYHYLLFLDQMHGIGNLLYHPNIFEILYCGPVVPNIYYEYIQYGSNTLPYDNDLPDISFYIRQNGDYRSSLRLERYYKFIDYITKTDYTRINHLVSITMGYKELYKNCNKQMNLYLNQEMYSKDMYIWSDIINYNRRALLN